MSILWTLRKFVDPVEHLVEEGDRRRQLAEEGDVDPGEVPLRIAPAARPAGAFRCRVCGHAGARGDYCPRCLAATMEPVRGA